jgi:predicted DNA-binding transcriptional regulator AlpA
MQNDPNDAMVPAPKFDKEMGITSRTRHRWMDDPRLDFPKATKINGRLYFSRRELDDWKERRFRLSLPGNPERAKSAEKARASKAERSRRKGAVIAEAAR